jgi:hypothetical protein
VEPQPPHGVKRNTKKTVPDMIKSDCYRRQAEVCMQLASAQSDQQAAIRLVELADELMTRAEEAAGAGNSISPELKALPATT